MYICVCTMYVRMHVCMYVSNRGKHLQQLRIIDVAHGPRMLDGGVPTTDALGDP